MPHLSTQPSNGIQIFDTDLEKISELHGHTGNVTTVSWKPDGTQLVSGGGSGDSSMWIWDYDAASHTFALSRSISLSTEYSRVWLLAWSPDGHHLASLGIIENPAVSEPIGEVRIWNTSSWLSEVISPYLFLSPTRSLTWNPDSTLVAVGGEIRCLNENGSCPSGLGGIYEISAVDGSLVFNSALATVPNVVAFSPTDQLAVSAYYLDITDGTTNQSLYAWNFTPSRIDWNSSGDKIVADNAGILQIIDLSTGATLRSFTPVGLWSVDWSPNDNYVATGSEEGVIELWDAKDLPSASGTSTVTPKFTASSTPITNNVLTSTFICNPSFYF